MSPVAALEPAAELSATAEPRGTTAADRRPRLATYLSAAIIVVVVTGFGVVGVVNLLPASVNAFQAGYAVVAAAALLAIQLLWFSRPSAQLDSTTSRVLFAVVVVLTCVPMLTFGLLWAIMLVYAGSAALLVLPPRYGWAVVVAILLGTVAIYQAFGVRPTTALYSMFATFFYILVFYLLSRLTRMVHELHAARTELAQRAVAEQRLAFARDLHDLLGMSLSAIALKGELVHRLMHKSAERAKAELAEITATAQRTLSDVRAVSHGYRELSLEKESRTAESLLSASEIAVRIHLDQGDLPVQVRTLLAKVLREGVTNVLRYSDVEHCEIDVRHQDGQVVLEIVNDGVTADDPDSTLTVLPDEVAALGGTATAKAGADGRFRLRVEVPLLGVPGEPAAAHGTEERSENASKQIRRLLPVVMVLMGIGATAHLLQLKPRPWEVALAVGSIVALLALQFSYFNRPSTQLRSAQSYGMLLVQACLIYLPLLPLGPRWVSLPGLLVGSALLVLPPVAGWVFFALNIAAYAAIQWISDADIASTIFYTAATVMTSLAVFGLLWLVRLVTELTSTRRRLAEMALAEERLRFARDLHDLLGMSLSAIALKSELTARVLPLDRDRAAEELTEVLGLTRQALSDVRSVASGYRELSLDSESRTARSVLVAADVRVRMELLGDDLPSPVRTVLAVVLREGVTNVLRHSRVEACEIVMRRTDGGICLDIVNDGVERDGHPATGRPGAGEEQVVPEPRAASVPPDSSPGSGIGNLSHRVTDLGGELTAGVEPDGRFRLRAVVPA